MKRQTGRTKIMLLNAITCALENQNSVVYIAGISYRQCDGFHRTLMDILRAMELDIQVLHQRHSFGLFNGTQIRFLTPYSRRELQSIRGVNFDSHHFFVDHYVYESNKGYELHLIMDEIDEYLRFRQRPPEVEPEPAPEEHDVAIDALHKLSKYVLLLSKYRWVVKVINFLYKFKKG